MKRKLISALLATAMVITLAACGKTKTTQTAASATTSAETTATTEVTQKELTLQEIKFGILLLHDSNSTYDKNFLDAFNAACEAKGVTGIIKTGIDESSACYEAAADLVDRGCDIVFADSFGHEAFLLQAAKEFPDVQFCHATGTMAHTENLPNFHNAFASIYEGRYLGGVAAGLKLNEMIASGKITADQAKLGYVGAYTYAEVVSGYTSYYLGAKSVCPTATMEVQFTGSWYDEALEKEATQTLINNGCVVMSQHADSMGAPTACEEAGIPDVSYNGSTLAACPNTFIVSSRINWQPYFEYLIDCVRDNKEIDTDWVGTIATGSVELTEVNLQAAAPGTVEAIEDVKNKFKSGELHVFDINTFTVNGETLSSYIADVDTDENYTPDTEVIKDGYFHESEYRSAPYFDIQIDGITLLNSAF